MLCLVKPFTTPGRKIPLRQPVPGGLFEFLVGHSCYACELRDDGRYGTDAQLFNDQLYMTVAEQRAALVAAGFSKVQTVATFGSLAMHRAT